MIRVAIVGGTGYTGVELLRLLAFHPEAEVVAVTSRSEAGRRVDDMFTSLRGIVDLEYTDPDSSPARDCDLAFFATPNGTAKSGALSLMMPPLTYVSGAVVGLSTLKQGRREGVPRGPRGSRPA